MKDLNVSVNFLEDTEALSDAEVGRLFRAMLTYACDGTEFDIKGNERLLWAVMKREIDRQRKCYEKKVAGAEKARQIRSDIRVNQNDINAHQNDIKANQNLEEKERSKEKEEACVIENTPTSVDINNSINTTSNSNNTSSSSKKRKSSKKNTVSLQKLSDEQSTELFNEFWEVYPRHTDKKDAVKSWNKLNQDGILTEELVSIMLGNIMAWKKTDQWSEPRYIPHASTWLNQERWNDVAPVKKDRLSNLGGLNQMYSGKEAAQSDATGNSSVVYDGGYGVPTGFGIF